MEIEFIEHPAETPPEPLPVPTARRPTSYLGLAAVVAFAAATALAAAAPFQHLFQFRFRTDGFSEFVTSDGWGRTRIVLSNGTPDPQQGGRYGAVFVVLAAMGVLLVLVAAVSAVRSRTLRATTPLAAILAGALATATAMIWLDAKSFVDAARALPGQEIGGTLAESISVEAGYGPAVWFGAAAAGCAGAGAALTALQHRASRENETSGTPDPSREPEPPTLPDHEQGEALTW